MKHYLISIPFSYPDSVLHSYLVTKKETDTQKALQKMHSLADDQGWEIGHLSTALVTELNETGIAAVRSVVSVDPKVAQLLTSVTEFHCTVWSMPATDAGNIKLMALH